MDRSGMRDYTGGEHQRTAPVVAPPEPPKARRRRKLPAVKPKSGWRTPLIIIAVAVFAWLAYGYVHTKNQLDKLSNPQTANESATQQTIDKVGKLVQLPTGETPTLATVTNAPELKNQAFFANAQNGDKLLIYSKANMGVLYRPSTNKVIEFGPPDFTSANQ